MFLFVSSRRTSRIAILESTRGVRPAKSLAEPTRRLKMSSRIDFIDLHLKMSIKEEKTTAITNEAITTIRSPAPVAPLQHSRAYALQCCSCLRITPYRCDICDDSVCEICWHEHLEEDFHLCPWCYLPELRQPTVTSTAPRQDIAAATLQMSGQKQSSAAVV